ncbi:MAG: hypothetical protein GY778_08415 [bacterium]|nr:hypothetical protein [bacterium]
MNRRSILRIGLLSAVGYALVVPAAATAQTERDRKQGDRPSAPKAGDSAPMMTLKALGDGPAVNLESLHGNKPVLLFFGSYT